MYVVMYPGQSCFGPFSSLDSAVEWCEEIFGADWKNIVKIHAVEPVR